MDKEIDDFLNYITNVAQLKNVTVGRERTSGKRDYIVFTLEDGTQLFGAWGKIGHLNARPNDKTPKHIGGKQPYAKLMIKELRKVVKAGMPVDYTGYVISLADNIGWDDGVLKNKRTKIPLDFKGITKAWNVSDKKGREVVKVLQQYNLLSHDETGYRVSTDFIVKGGKKK